MPRTSKKEKIDPNTEEIEQLADTIRDLKLSNYSIGEINIQKTKNGYEFAFVVAKRKVAAKKTSPKSGKKNSPAKTPKKEKKVSPKKTNQKKKTSAKKQIDEDTLIYTLNIRIRGYTSGIIVNKFWKLAAKNLKEQLKGLKYTFEKISDTDGYTIEVERGRFKVDSINKKMYKFYENLYMDNETNFGESIYEIELTGNDIDELIYAD